MNMFILTKIVTAIVLPPFNILILWLFSLVLGYFKRPKWRNLTAWLGIILLYLFSIPYTADKLQRSLSDYPPIGLAEYRQAQAIVLLGGGLRSSQEGFAALATNQTAFGRVRYAAYLQQSTQLPLLITGGSSFAESEAAVMARELNSFFHIPTRWLEEQARNTAQNAQFSHEILAKEGINQIILVTDQWHMQRAKFLFEQAGFVVFPAGVGSLESENYGFMLFDFMPQAAALLRSSTALREWLGYWKVKYW